MIILASHRLKQLEALRKAGKGESQEAQKLALQLKDDLEGISNRVNQCAAKPTGEMPTKAVLDKLGKLLRDPMKVILDIYLSEVKIRIEQINLKIRTTEAECALCEN